MFLATTKKRRVLASLVVMMALSALPGCGRYYWSKPGATVEQFAGDSRECLAEAKATAPAAPPDVAAGAVEHLYRACLAARGYARAKVTEPAPPGSYRGLESPDEFAGMATPASTVPAPHRLDGRWRRVGSGSASLTLRISGPDVTWEYEAFGSQGLAVPSQYGDPGTVYRGAGSGTIDGEHITLVGHLSVGDPFSRGPLTFNLRRSGPSLKGAARGPSNIPVDVEFTR